eukprot:10085228-Alexandrium_andersonii.AAC.1
MSASLVGSEMCIRDRSTVKQIPGSEGRPLEEATSSPAAAAGGGSAGAVSYTHLTLPTICSV